MPRSAVSRVELLDAATVRAVNDYEETSYADAPTLFVEFGGTRASVDADLAFAQEVAATEGCPALDYEVEAEARNRLWKTPRPPANRENDSALSSRWVSM